MPLNNMRIGETVEVEGQPLDAAGNPTEFLQGEAWDSTATGVATVTPDGINPRLAEVEAVAPGAATITFEGTNQFSDPMTAQAPATVLDASRFVIQLGPTNHVVVRRENGRFVFIPDHELSPGGLRVTATATAVDDRFGPKEPGTGSDDAMPDYSGGLTNIEWTTDSQFILFDVGFGADPTASDVLTLDLVPNVAGEDVVHLTALNSLSQPISADIRILVLATAGAQIVASDAA